ncbi:MAG: hypothetical protein ACRD0X_02395 [Thermoanaerobaculia bacterium]
MPIDSQILLGSLALSLVHAAIPSHWLPLVLLARSERWSRSRALGATALAGGAHSLSTIAVGVAVGLFGKQLAATHGELLRLGAPALLALLGLVYLGLQLRERGHEHAHEHGVSPEAVRGRSGLGVLAALCAAMFFSPCLEIEAYFFLAGGHGWSGIAAVAALYFALTVAGMVALVGLGLAGLSHLDLHWLDHYEMAVVGLAFLALAGLAYWLG